MKKLFCLFATLLFFTPCYAQEISAEEEQQLIDFINGVVNGVVNAGTLFTSQETVSSGYFKFAEQDGRRKIDVLKIPFKYYLCDDETVRVRPYLRGMLGQANETESISPEPGATGESDFSGVYIKSVSLGGGVDLELFDNFKLTPDFSASYSRVKNKYDYNNDISQFIGLLVDGQVFNWDIDMMTYSPSIKAQYEIPLDFITVRLQSSYSHLINRSFSSSSDILDIDSSTNLVRNIGQIEVPTGVDLFSAPMVVRPFFSRSDIGGAAKKSLGFSFYYESGADLVFKTKDSLALISELSIGASYTWADNFEGTRIGFGAAF